MVCASNMQAALAVNCGDYIAANVVLTADLECDTGYVALEVANHNVTIDLNGFTLSGSSELAGISVNGFDNLVVKNGSIKGFWAGINGFRSDRLNVDSVTFYEVGHGVIINAGNNARVQNNDFIKTTGPAVFISVRSKFDSANQNLVSRNEFYRAAGGISICGSQADKNVISDNLIWKSSSYGIHLNHSDRNQIYRNRVLETIDSAALRLNNASYNTVKNNTFREGEHAGVSILGNAADGCLNSDFGFSGKNKLSENQISEFQTGVILGLGFADQRNVDGTGIFANRITDNDIGIFSQSDARNSYGSDNNFTGTTRPVLDFGVNNRY